MHMIDQNLVLLIGGVLFSPLILTINEYILRCGAEEKQPKEKEPFSYRMLQERLKLRVICKECEMEYQTDNVTRKLNQLFIVDKKVIGHTISYKELMNLPRLLLRNILIFLFSFHD
jgi:hypothetical protein